VVAGTVLAAGTARVDKDGGGCDNSVKAVRVVVHRIVSRAVIYLTINWNSISGPNSFIDAITFPKARFCSVNITKSGSSSKSVCARNAPRLIRSGHA